MLELIIKRKAEKFLSKCNEDLYLRLLDRIELLRVNPYPSDSKRVYDKELLFRVRVGDYRVLYLVKDTKLFIVVIDKRSKVYR
jgi:mRNA interferase RelE/StbE